MVLRQLLLSYCVSIPPSLLPSPSKASGDLCFYEGTKAFEFRGNSADMMVCHVC